jgi:hypothetical protein
MKKNLGFGEKLFNEDGSLKLPESVLKTREKSKEEEKKRKVIYDSQDLIKEVLISTNPTIWHWTFKSRIPLHSVMPDIKMDLKWNRNIKIFKQIDEYTYIVEIKVD